MLQTLEWRHALDRIPLKAPIQKVNKLLIVALQDIFDALRARLANLSARIRLQLGLAVRLKEYFTARADGD